MSAAVAGVLVAWGHAQLAPPSTFAREVGELSEPGGSFDTDNLISNERSYLHVIPAIKERGTTGGAYVGVGPDQNFSYVAAARPAIAFIIDVRRDNLLLHLLFKALFHLSDTRAEYVGRLFGRRLPARGDRWRGASLGAILSQVEATEVRREDAAAMRKEVTSTVAAFGVPLSASDLTTIDRFYRTFIDEGLSLKFQSYGRAPRSYYPTYQELLLETDRQGRQVCFLAAEPDYEFVRDLERRDLVIPVVGNLAGPTALASIGRFLRQRNETVSVIYVSNVELYLFQNGVFNLYAGTMAGLPRTKQSLIIRSIFTGPGVWSLPDMKPGYASASVTQPLDEFAGEYAAHKYLSYAGLIERHR